MAVVEASVTKASGSEESECANMTLRDRLALLSSKAVLSTGVQAMGWEPLTREPARTSCRGDWVAAA